MSYSSRSKHSTSPAWLAIMTAVAAVLATLTLAGCNPFSSGTDTGSTVPTATPKPASVETTIPFVTVPDVSGLDVQDAQNKLLDQGLLFTVKWHRSDSVPMFEVYKQNPEPSDEATPGTYVTVYTSIGTQAQPPGMKTDAMPKPRKPKWTRVTNMKDAWILSGVGTGTSPSKTFDDGWLGVAGLVVIPIRVRLDHPNGVQNIMVETAENAASDGKDVRLDQLLSHGAALQDAVPRRSPPLREDQVRVLRVVQAEAGGYKILVRTPWNQPWFVLVRWAPTNKRGDFVYPPIWP